MIVLVIFKKRHPPRRGVARFSATTARTFHCQLSFQKQPFKGVLRKTCSENIQEIYRRTHMQKCNFRTLAWVFSCKFAAYFQNTFSQEHLRRAASAFA